MSYQKNTARAFAQADRRKHMVHGIAAAIKERAEYWLGDASGTPFDAEHKTAEVFVLSVLIALPWCLLIWAAV